MSIGGKGPSDAQPVGARLLLHDAPPAGRILLTFFQARYQGVPHDACFHPGKTPLRVNLDYPVKLRGVQQHAVAEELLSSHGVPPTHCTEAFPTAAHCDHRLLHLGQRPGGFHPLH